MYARELHYPLQTPAARFVAACHRRRYPRKAVIIRAGERLERLGLLVTGCVAVRLPDDHSELAVDHLCAGAFLGELSLFGEDTRAIANVVALEPCEVAEIGHARFHQLAANDPAVLWPLAQQIAERLEDTSEKLLALACHEVRDRVVRELQRLAVKCGQPDAAGEGIAVRVTRVELGALCGCSREMAGRAVNELVRAGVLRVRGREITLLDSR